MVGFSGSEMCLWHSQPLDHINTSEWLRKRERERENGGRWWDAWLRKRGMGREARSLVFECASLAFDINSHINILTASHLCPLILLSSFISVSLSTPVCLFLFYNCFIHFVLLHPQLHCLAICPSWLSSTSSSPPFTTSTQRICNYLFFLLFTCLITSRSSSPSLHYQHFRTTPEVVLCPCSTEKHKGWWFDYDNRHQW